MPIIYAVVYAGYLYIFIILMFVQGTHQRDVACTNCLNTADCEQEAVCTAGCQPWWAGSRCHKHIIIPDHDTEYMTVLQVSLTSVVVTWQPLQHLPPGNYTYYHYLVTYRENGSRADEKGPVVKHDPARINLPLQAMVTSLRPDTHYQFRVWPFRQNLSNSDYGKPYEAFMYMYALDDDETVYTDDETGEDRELGEGPRCGQTLAWSLFGITGVIAVILCGILAHLVRKYIRNQPRRLLIAPNPEDFRVKIETEKYTNPRGISDVASICSGDYEEPVNYYKQHIVTPAPYESLDSRFHAYENNSGPYEGLKTSQQCNSSMPNNLAIAQK